MRRSVLTLCVASAMAAAGGAKADHAPSFVVPGRPDVPVIINGMYASWGVAEGDWGLYRPGAVPVTVIPGPYPPPYQPPARPYYPSLGGKPYSGRYEIEPPADRPLPKPAQAYHRSWSVESPKVPPTEYAPSPPMMISPEINFNDPRQMDSQNQPPFQPSGQPRRRR